MTAHRSALISGASIAGPTLAYWLRRRGWHVTVVERYGSIRAGGYPIDIRGTALDVMERMGALERVRDAHIDTQKATFLSPDGTVLGSVDPAMATSGISGRDFELPRGSLAEILWDLTKDDVEYVFNDSITSIEQHPDRVDVEFERSEPRSFDFVFGADGLHSNVRRLVFGPDAEFDTYLGWCFAGFTYPNRLGLSREAFMFNRPGRVGSLYAVGEHPDRVHAFLVYQTERPADSVLRDADEMRRRVVDAFAGVDAWEIPAMVATLAEADDAYCDSVSQVHMTSWSKGRVALVGDAAHATSFLSGQGSSVSLVTAYVLANELARGDDHEAAFRGWQDSVREFVKVNQQLADGGTMVCVSSARALRVRNVALRRVVPVLARLGLMRLLGRKPFKASTAMTLPAYEPVS